jgi:histidyl-tRNA synthetase
MPIASARPTGFYDRTPSQNQALAHVQHTLTTLLARFGYPLVETPLVEHADLYLTKSGEEAMGRLFTFEIHGRLLCLRSEFTPSAARLYVENYQNAPKPVRLGLAGPVFRYEALGKGASRQMYMVGAELIGMAGPAADAEMIGLAANGLQALSLTGWQVTIGHVGLISRLLDRFALERRTKRFILGQIENLRRPKRGRPYVEAQIERLYAGLPAELDPTSGDTQEMGRALQMVLTSADLGPTGSGRTSEDIARRLISKRQRASQRASVMAALDFLEKLITVQGAIPAALDALEALIPSDDPANATAQAFRHLFELLPAYGVPMEAIQIEMGMARGLNYYTGLVFEIHRGQNKIPLCGGGRYDELISVLGAAHDTPAVGLAFNLERLLQEFYADQPLTEQPLPPMPLLVVPAQETDNLEAARIATRLRQTYNVELAPAGLTNALRRADKRGIPHVVIVGQKEAADGQITLRHMADSIQKTITLAALDALLKKGAR